MLRQATDSVVHLATDGSSQEGIQKGHKRKRVSLLGFLRGYPGHIFAYVLFWGPSC